MSKVITSDRQLAELLSKTKRVAVVGISDKEDRPSNGVSRWLKKNSHFELYFVNPALTTVLDQPCYASLADIPVKIDMVDIFRKVSDIPAVVDEAIAIEVKEVAVACPFCRIMVSDGMTARESDIGVLDVAQVLLRNIKG
jgi:predicted CoA-binding protein